MQFLLTQLALKLTTPFTIQARLVRRLLVPHLEQAVLWQCRAEPCHLRQTICQWRAVMTDTPTGMATTNGTADGYRLPTEAEWVYAARGGINHSAFTYSGSNTVDNVAVAYSAKNALCFALKRTAKKKFRSAFFLRRWLTV